MNPTRLALIVVAVCIAIAAGCYWLVPKLVPGPSIPPGERAWTIESDEMQPTLKPGDTLTTRKVGEADLRRGMIVAYRRTKNDIGFFRIAGLPGDQIDVSKGVVAVNGQEASLHVLGADKDSRGDALYLYMEQFPGEQGAHRIAWTSSDMMRISVPPGRVFLIGDKRSNHWDSRYMKFGSPDTVRTTDIIGKVDGIIASADAGRIGKPLDVEAGEWKP